MKPVILFDIPMCMAHRGLWALLQEMSDKPTCALFVNRRRTGAKLVLNHEVILHVRTESPMDAEKMIRLL